MLLYYVYFLFLIATSVALVVTGENENSVKRTMFEELDDKISRMLRMPKPDECKHLLKLMKLYQTTMFRIRRMVENNDMEMVRATQKIYDSGGPRFLQIKIYEQNFKKNGWSDEDLDQYYNLRLITDQAWFELRRILFSG